MRGLIIDVNSVDLTKSFHTFSLTFDFDIFFHSFAAGKSRLGSLLSLGHSPGKTDRLYMRGPGGRGEVEVAVSGVTGKDLLSLYTSNNVMKPFSI